MKSPFENRALPINGPAYDIIPVIPNDTTNLDEVAVALYVEGAGTVAFITAKGNQRSVSVTDFSLLPVGARRVLSSGTTATGIHALTAA